MPDTVNGPKTALSHTALSFNYYRAYVKNVNILLSHLAIFQNMSFKDKKYGF
jgi:hypothetical protein